MENQALAPYSSPNTVSHLHPVAAVYFPALASNRSGKEARNKPTYKQPGYLVQAKLNRYIQYNEINE
jgi:hypothetical protein